MANQPTLVTHLVKFIRRWWPLMVFRNFGEKTTVVTCMKAL